MFCGDGINDLAALSAADVGMAIGATDAVIGAELSTSHASVAGCHHLAAILFMPLRADMYCSNTVHTDCVQ